MPIRCTTLYLVIHACYFIDCTQKSHIFASGWNKNQLGFVCLLYNLIGLYNKTDVLEESDEGIHNYLQNLCSSPTEARGLMFHHTNVNIPSHTGNCDSENLHVFSGRYKGNILGLMVDGEVECTPLLLYRVLHSSIIWVLHDSDEEAVLIVFEIWVKLFINKHCWQDIFGQFWSVFFFFASFSKHAIVQFFEITLTDLSILF